MVIWPPAPVMELARLAVDSGGDPGAIQRLLDPTMLPVSAHCCSIISKGYGILHSLGRSSFGGECSSDLKGRDNMLCLLLPPFRS
jgi:hypothetical protein